MKAMGVLVLTLLAARLAAADVLCPAPLSFYGYDCAQSAASLALWTSGTGAASLAHDANGYGSCTVEVGTLGYFPTKTNVILGRFATKTSGYLHGHGTAEGSIAIELYTHTATGLQYAQASITDQGLTNGVNAYWAEAGYDSQTKCYAVVVMSSGINAIGLPDYGDFMVMTTDMCFGADVCSSLENGYSYACAGWNYAIPIVADGAGMVKYFRGLGCATDPLAVTVCEAAHQGYGPYELDGMGAELSLNPCGGCYNDADVEPPYLRESTQMLTGWPVGASEPVTEVEHSGGMLVRQAPEDIGCEVLVCGATGGMTFGPYVQGNSYGKYVWQFAGSGSMTPELIRNEYAWVVDINRGLNTALGYSRWPVDPGPLLIISGARGIGDNCIGAMPFDDVLNTSPGTCWSDLLMTDTNGDLIPEGPVTRIPARWPAEVDTVVARGEVYSRAQWPRYGNYVGMLVDDSVNSSYEILLNPVIEAYRRMGNVPLGVIRTSDYPGASRADLWATTAGYLNRGVNEIFGRGRTSSEDNWFLLMRPVGDAEYGLLTTGRMCLAWLPSCDTIDHWADPSYQWGWQGRPIAIELMNPPDANPSKTMLAAVAGSYNGGWNNHWDMMAEELAIAREAAVPGTTTVAEINFNAVRSFMAGHPEIAVHGLSMGVLGSYVVIASNTTTGVEGGVGGSPALRVVQTGGPRVFVELATNGGGTPVEVAVYDLRGRLVRRLFPRDSTGDVVSIEWDGRGAGDRTAASGVYVLRAAVGNKIVQAKVAIIR